MASTKVVHKYGVYYTDIYILLKYYKVNFKNLSIVLYFFLSTLGVFH